MNDLCIMTHRTDPDRPRRAIDGGYICDGCVAQLERLVAEMPARYAALERVLATGGTGGQRVSGTASEPLPINLAVAEHRHHMAGVMASWARLVAEERGIMPPASPALAVCGPWLTVHIQWCARQRWVDEMLTELRQANGRARAMLNPDGSKRIAIGPCRTAGETGPCTGTLYATVRAEDDERPSAIYCDGCEFEKSPEEWLRFGRTYARMSA